MKTTSVAYNWRSKEIINVKEYYFTLELIWFIPNEHAML